MTTLMYQPQFHEAVRTGEKRQTIRPPRRDGKPICKVGDILSHRGWEGVAYRRKQQRLRDDSPCLSVGHVLLAECIEVNGVKVADPDEFARADGFTDAREMCLYFLNNGGLPFEGVLIQW